MDYIIICKIYLICHFQPHTLVKFKLVSFRGLHSCPEIVSCHRCLAEVFDNQMLREKTLTENQREVNALPLV